MFRYVKSATTLASMFEDFDLEDFGDIVQSRLSTKFPTSEVNITSVEISGDLNNEWLDVKAEVEGLPFTASVKLDGRRLRKPRDLILNYADLILQQFKDLLNEAGVFGASYSMEQEFTSKQTASGNGSFNKGQGRVPALFKKISWSPNTVNFDYGCGYKSTQERIAEFLADKGVEYIGFDKFNQTPAEQEEAWAAIESVGGADTATCANVLNVVKERDVRVNEIIANVYDVLKSGGTAYFDVYEGDRSSAGGQTGKDNYQLKRPVDGYVEEVAEIFGDNNVKLKGKLIIAKK